MPAEIMNRYNKDHHKSYQKKPSSELALRVDTTVQVEFLRKKNFDKNSTKYNQRHVQVLNNTRKHNEICLRRQFV